MTHQQITGALFVDMGQARRDGTWIRPPRARYECLTCGTTEGPVAGALTVASFVARIRTDHRATCTTGARAAA
ncbi:hypothetical protein AB0N23_13380 [Streptomyces sp. NPDC052644]